MRASSCASTTTRRALSVNLSNITSPLARPEAGQRAPTIGGLSSMLDANVVGSRTCPGLHGFNALRARGCSGLGVRSQRTPGFGASVRRGVRLPDLGGHPATIGDLPAVGLGPLANGRRVGRAATGALAPGAPPSTDPACLGDVLREAVAQCPGILGREVDLVIDAVETEPDRLLGLAAIEVVNEENLDLLRHDQPFR